MQRKQKTKQQLLNEVLAGQMYNLAAIRHAINKEALALTTGLTFNGDIVDQSFVLRRCKCAVFANDANYYIRMKVNGIGKRLPDLTTYSNTQKVLYLSSALDALPIQGEVWIYDERIKHIRFCIKKLGEGIWIYVGYYSQTKQESQRSGYPHQVFGVKERVAELLGYEMNIHYDVIYDFVVDTW